MNPKILPMPVCVRCGLAGRALPVRNRCSSPIQQSHRSNAGSIAGLRSSRPLVIGVGGGGGFQHALKCVIL